MKVRSATCKDTSVMSVNSGLCEMTGDECLKVGDFRDIDPRSVRLKQARAIM